MTKDTQAKRRTAAQWAEVVKRWKESELSSGAFAKREGLNARTLVWWSSELRRRGKGKQRTRRSRRSSPAFSDVRVVQQPTAQPAAAASEPVSSIEVQSRSGRVVRAVGAVDREALAVLRCRPSDSDRCREGGIERRCSVPRSMRPRPGG